MASWTTPAADSPRQDLSEVSIDLSWYSDSQDPLWRPGTVGPEAVTTVAAVAEDVLEDLPEVVGPSPLLLTDEEGVQTPPPRLQTPLNVQRPVSNLLNSCVIREDRRRVGLRNWSDESSPEGAVARTPSPGGSPLLERAVLVNRQLAPRQEPDLNDALLSNLFDSSLDDSGSPGPQTFTVNTHRSTPWKMVAWSLRVDKKWLIMGDSNLSRLPQHTIADLQIESYPGANFRHAGDVISKAAVNTTVETVVLSFGINNRTQKAVLTAVKQLQGAVRAAKRMFPHAEIWIPLVNFSPLLPFAERETLTKLNDHIRKTMPFIPLLEDRLFQVEEDHVHWTDATARAIFDHWVSFLDSTSP